MRVAVCAITYKRPEGLEQMLRGLDALTFQGPAPDLTVTIVDNDPQESARAVCEALGSELSWPLRYETEARRGIPFARNKAVACVVDDVDFLAFIDDDEFPMPSWLDELLSVQQEYDADVVTGPVIPEYPNDVPEWIVRGKLFDSQRWPTGHLVDVAFTNNVLVRTEVFRAMDPIFDERLALTGGTDSYFFRRAHRAGFSIVWADDAHVREWIPKSRTRFRWLVQRAFRTGIGMTIIETGLRPFWWTRVTLLAKACAWLAIGLAMAVPGLILGRRLLVSAVRYMAYGAGRILGMFGARYREYRTTHGT